MQRATLLFLAMMAQPALAADWFSELEMRPSADWTGAYVGAFGGAAISKGRATLAHASGVVIPTDVANGLFPRSIAERHVGPAIGLTAGFNVQSGGFVGGIEADLGYGWTKARHAFSRLDDTGAMFPIDVHTNTTYGTDFGALATLRLRGGYAFGNTLLFGTAGLAAGDVANHFSLALPELPYASPDWSKSGLRLGYAVGAGIEHRLSDAVSVKFETLYINLADRTVHGTDPDNFGSEAISYRFDNDLLLPRLGINVKF